MMSWYRQYFVLCNQMVRMLTVRSCQYHHTIGHQPLTSSDLQRLVFNGHMICLHCRLSDQVILVICQYTCALTYSHILMYKRTHTHDIRCTYICANTCKHMRIHMHIYSFIYTHMHQYTYMHIHTHNIYIDIIM